MPARSITVTPDLQRSMIRDSTSAVLTTPRALLLWAVVALLLVVGIVLALRGAPQLLIWPVVFVVLFPILAGRSVRRSIRAALPVGSVLVAELLGPRLHLETPSGVHDVALTTYRKVVVRSSVVLLHLKGSQIFSALPRALFGADDLERLRAGIDSPVTAP